MANGAALPPPAACAVEDDRFGNALIFSIIVHLAVIFGVAFTQPNPKWFDAAEKTLDVVLVNAKGARPVRAEALAQADLDAGGEADSQTRATSPVLAAPQDSRYRDGAHPQAPAVAAPASAPPVIAETPRPPVAPSAPTTAPGTADLAARSLEMARLLARLDPDRDAAQARAPRKLHIGPRTREYAYARYLEDWRAKVERIGNLNYPEEARRQRLYGSLILEVCLDPDGRLHADRGGNPALARSSGSALLDDAAIRIVQMSAPFAPFPAAMREALRQSGKDVLCFTRTWTFTREDLLTSQ